MGLIQSLLGMIFGGSRNVIKETAEVFTVNAEASAVRDAQYQHAALSQFGKEFNHAKRGMFDRFVDALNRLPRPVMALGTIGLFASAMYDPMWFSSRMQGVTLVPEPLWWLMGAIVSFYFGARHQAKSQEFQRSIAQTVGQFSALQAKSNEKDDSSRGLAPSGPIAPSDNPALKEWEQNARR